MVFCQSKGENQAINAITARAIAIFMVKFFYGLAG